MDIYLVESENEQEGMVFLGGIQRMARIFERSIHVREVVHKLIDQTLPDKRMFPNITDPNGEQGAFLSLLNRATVVKIRLGDEPTESTSERLPLFEQFPELRTIIQKKGYTL
jgi:hypothetical protein